MPSPFRIVCRGSSLSLAQATIVKKALQRIDPEATVELIIKETRGDINQELPLHEMEGKDFFTRDIQDYLISGKADFAVHSLKDVSGENFFDGNHYAIIEREDPRDAALFNKDIREKIERGEKIRLGTSSPRRVEMAVRFLAQALPRTRQKKLTLEAAPIRGNVDTRLQKLANGEYDGIILACAGLNRLLKDENENPVASLLKEKPLMILPLLTCPPAPGQGAIVAETTPDNLRAIKLLQALNDGPLSKAVDQERKIAHLYGSGCHQKFGVIHIDTGGQAFIYAAGRDRKDAEFAVSYSQEGTVIHPERKPVTVDSSDPLFLLRGIDLVTSNVGHRKEPGLPAKRVWVSETETWFTLAENGIWVEGSLEGFGLKFIEVTLTSPLANLGAKQVNVSLN